MDMTGCGRSLQTLTAGTENALSQFPQTNKQFAYGKQSANDDETVTEREPCRFSELIRQTF